MKAKKERPKPACWRVFEKHRAIAKKYAKKDGVSAAQIMRTALEEYDETRKYKEALDAG